MENQAASSIPELLEGLYQEEHERKVLDGHVILTRGHFDAETIMDLAEKLDDLNSILRVYRNRPDGSRELVLEAHNPASADQVRYFHNEPFLCTGIAWSGLAIAGRIEATAHFAIDPQATLEERLIDMLPEFSKEYLTFWQQQINTGACWFAPGKIGEKAHLLLLQGYLLWGRKKIRNAYGVKQPSRYSEVQGEPGTAAFVERTMGRDYLDWLQSAEMAES